MFSLRRLRIKAMQYLFVRFFWARIEKEEGQDVWVARAQQEARQYIRESVEQIHAGGALFLQLSVAWAEIERRRADSLIERPATPLYDDLLLRELRLHPMLEWLRERYPLPLGEEEVDRWYDNYLSHPYSSRRLGVGGEAIFVRLVKYFFKDKVIEQRLSGLNMTWFEDQALVYQRLRHFVECFSEAPAKGFALYEVQLAGGKEDFFVRLVTRTLEAVDLHHGQLQEHVENWRIDRINMLDQVLIRMALSEVAFFPEIPKKVSINEYLEIAKKYSDEKSIPFINGVVDRIAGR